MRTIFASFRQLVVAWVTMLLLLGFFNLAPADEPAHTIAMPLVMAPPAALTVNDEAGLRAAIQSANATQQMPRIELTADITLTAPLPAFNNPGAAPATIQGNGHRLDARGIGPILAVGPKTVVVVERLTLAGGEAALDSCGGGVFSAGDLTLRQSRVSGNRADRGGGICVIASGVGAFLTLEQTIMDFNVAQIDGGALFVRAENNATVSVSVADSILSDNLAAGGNGGAIYTYARDGSTTLTLARSTVSSNRAAGTAGLYNIGNESYTEPGYAGAFIRNSTFSGNVSTDGDGGAIANHSYPPVANGTPERPDGPSSSRYPPLGFGHVQLSYSTITANIVIQGGGGGIFNAAYSPFFQLFGVIIAGNGPGKDCAGSITSNGYNLYGDSSCGLGQPTDLPSGQADLQTLEAYPPGLTPTHALGPASQARDRIPAGEAGCDPAVDTDQRGVGRPQPAGGRCDIGSYEVSQ